MNAVTAVSKSFSRSRSSSRFDGEAMRLGEACGPDDGQDDRQPGIQISGTTSDLALFLWQRPVAGRLDVQGDASLLGRYFTLVPPL
jgi:hypothetical protein